MARSGDIITNLVHKRFGHKEEPDALEITTNTDIGRDVYISMYGPTVGDRVRLGDTALWIEIERDEVSLTSTIVHFFPYGLLQTVYGEEVKFGGGKSLSLLDASAC